VFYEAFYTEKGKRITSKILDNLFSSFFSLAIWYMDDGSLNKGRGRVTLHTEGFTYEENLLIKEALANKLNIEAKVYPNRKRGLYFLCLNRPNARSFFDIIYPYIIPSMEYKLPLRYHGGV